jgi:hypothetical protein
VFYVLALCKNGRRQGEHPFPISDMAAMIRPRFLWGHVKDSALLPPLPQDLPQLRRRDIAAIPEINRDVLQRVWAEMDIGVTSAVLQRADTYRIYEVSKKKNLRVFFPSAGRILQSFPPLKWTDFVNCVGEL